MWKLSLDPARLRTLKVKTLDWMVTSCVLALIWAGFEQIAEREQIEHLLSIQNQAYRAVSSFAPWSLAATFYREAIGSHAGIGAFFYGAFAAVEIAFDENGPLLGLLIVALYVTVSYKVIRFNLSSTNEQEQGPRLNPILHVSSLLGVSAGLTSFSCFMIKMCMLVSLLLFGWLLQAAQLFAAIPILYWFVLHRTEDTVSGRLLKLVKTIARRDD